MLHVPLSLGLFKLLFALVFRAVGGTFLSRLRALHVTRATGAHISPLIGFPNRNVTLILYELERVAGPSTVKISGQAADTCISLSA